MLTRLGRLAGLLVISTVALLGLLVIPGGLLVACVVLTMATGPVVALMVHRAAKRDPAAHATAAPGSTGSRCHRAARAGTTASAAVLGTSLVVAGLVALLGAVAVLVVPMLLAATATMLRRRRRAESDLGPLRSDPPPAPPRLPAPGGSPVRGPARSLRPPVLDTGTVPTAVLCAAWQRTYWLLQDISPASPDHLAVIALRVRLLDEFDRRDPDGLARWLDTGPRAGSDPGRYLTADQ